MAKKLSQSDPALAIEFFLSGFYTHRSQLFAPFKPIGINVVSFHDPVIDGANMENTDLYEWQRRPGFSLFCSVPLSDTEIVRQFYSSRNMQGVVVPLVDTSQRLAIFSPTAITEVLSKTTTGQGYPSTIQNMTYFSDGVSADLYKFTSAPLPDGIHLSAWGLAAPTVSPVSSGQGFWQPYTSFAIGDSILDTNGNVESVSAILIPNGAFKPTTLASNLALGGSSLPNWTHVAGLLGGYAVEVGYKVVQQTSGARGTSTATVTFAAPVTAGNTILVTFGQYTAHISPPTVVSVTDNLSDTYTQVT